MAEANKPNDGGELDHVDVLRLCLRVGRAPKEVFDRIAAELGLSEPEDEQCHSFERLRRRFERARERGQFPALDEALARFELELQPMESRDSIVPDPVPNGGLAEK